MNKSQGKQRCALCRGILRKPTEELGRRLVNIGQTASVAPRVQGTRAMIVHTQDIAVSWPLRSSQMFGVHENSRKLMKAPKLMKLRASVMNSGTSRFQIATRGLNKLAPRVKYICMVPHNYGT